MKIHYIQHATFEKLGAIEVWARKNNHELSGTHVYDGEKLPENTDFDLLVIMGGPQSPFEVDKYPYLNDEIALVKKAIKNNKKVWGTCLGAQIIAEALGVSTLRSEHKEVGMYPITVLDEGKNDPIFSQFGDIFDVMHWHNDMPGIPDGAILLAKSDGCSHQAFRYGDRVYGFQFHLEPTLELIKGMIKHCSDDLEANRYVRSEAELMASDYDAINQKMFAVLDYFNELPERNSFL